MKKHDTIITLKIPSVLKSKLVVAAQDKGITLSELVRLRVNNVQTYNNEDIPTTSLREDDHITLKRCQRCNGIFMPNRIGQLYCCNGCGCRKSCSCGAVELQQLLII